MRNGDAPYNRFREFIAPGADRLGVLTSLLDNIHLPYQTADIAGNRHVLVFPSTAGAGSPPKSVLVAHYDRTAGSPGANDNSAAVFILMETAMRLHRQENETWLVIFTDKEELSGDEGIREQGSYTLAKFLRTAGLGGNRFYIFDACGAGDTLIISTTADRLMKDEKGIGVSRARRQVQLLRRRALEASRRLIMEKVLLAPTPFSDDAGFLRAGIAAQTITALPAVEAARLAALRHRNGFAEALINREAAPGFRRFIPETWRTLNSPADSILRLTPQNFGQVVRFACELCRE
ncbi:MAG: M28 family peptidase [Spirochaetaceae bacterium]|nr:M28 family peptidase [Spirochaetaceae bacterium]